MTQDELIWRAPCVNHPELSVTVSRTAVGTYCMMFRDDDARAIIETRIFNYRDSAESCAHRLMTQP
tara:strand:- start:302 stop:499 length:198 start_codon:yes stop_codon:yes gene_type:complete